MLIRLFAERAAAFDRRFRGCALAFAAVALLGCASIAPAQEMTDDMIGQDEQLWRIWSAAVAAVERDKLDEAGKQFDDLLALKPSDLRLALMADRSGTLKLEEAGDKLGAAGAALMAQIKSGRRQRQLAEDGWHFAAIGRFGYADANLKALVDSHPDPVALLELSRYNLARTQTLIKLVNHAEVGPAARLVLKLLQEGEDALRRDAREIEVNIERLAGSPRVVYQAVNNLKQSGEYAIPQLLAYLQDGRKAALHAAILQVLPQIGRGGVNPLVIALSAKNQTTRMQVADALAAIAYPQAAPYLALAVADANSSPEAKAAATRALSGCNRLGTAEPASLFRTLANDYYKQAESLASDPRVEQANVWYLDEKTDQLKYVAVPRAIFCDIMTMRCAEQALRLAHDDAPSIALWLAANFRREARLGMDVESEAASDHAARDGTKPPGYPRAIYFARAAGPRYNHLVLSRAVADKDPGVALGAIAALDATAGPNNLLGPEDARQSLALALQFPNRLVRIKAALAIARTLPRSEFLGSQNVVPVLAEALGQPTRRTALVIDPEQQSRNALQAVLRGAQYDVYAAETLYAAAEQARQAGNAAIDAVIVGSDVTAPALPDAVREIRERTETSAAPVLILIKPRQTTLAREAARHATGVETLLSDALHSDAPEKSAAAVVARLGSAAAAMGMRSLDPERSIALALAAAEALRQLGLLQSSVLDVSRAERALVASLAHANEELRIKAAAALAVTGTESAQRVLAKTALDAERAKEQRIATFASLSEHAGRFGNKLDEGLVQQIVKMSRDAADLELRTACSQALGALNLANNQASEIIRAQSRDAHEPGPAQPAPAEPKAEESTDSQE
ncbi:MAG: hypothetical protein U1A27_08040 [Phycisphaerae bacterium]